MPMGISRVFSSSQINVLKYSPRILQCMWCPNKTQISHNIADTQIISISAFFFSWIWQNVGFTSPPLPTHTNTVLGPIGNPRPPVHKEIIGGLFYSNGKASNKAAKVTATCLSKGKKPLLFLTSLWPKIPDNWKHWHQKHKWRYANEVINYLSPKFGRDLTVNKNAFQ